MCRAALHVINEEIGMRALPFAVRAGHQSPVERSELFTRSAQLFIRGHFGRGYENSKKAFLAAIGIDLAAVVVCNLDRRNRNFHGALVAEIHMRHALLYPLDRVRFAAFAAAHPVST